MSDKISSITKGTFLKLLGKIQAFTVSNIGYRHGRADVVEVCKMLNSIDLLKGKTISKGHISINKRSYVQVFTRHAKPNARANSFDVRVIDN